MIMNKHRKEPFVLDATKKLLHKPSRFPYSIQLDITSFCNLKCRMCCRNFIGQDPSHIDFITFQGIVDRLEGVKEVSLVGLGEPLTYPKIFEAIEYCKSMGLHVKTTSNGLLLNTKQKARDIILSGLDSISFSIDSCHNINPAEDDKNRKALKNIKKLMDVKLELGIPTPKITLQSVLFKDHERDIYDIIEWGASNEVNRINVLRLDLYFDTGLKRPDIKEERAFFKELSRLRKIYQIRIDCLQDQYFTGPKAFLYKHFKRFLRLDSCCIRLLDYPQIDQQGNLIPCCVLPGQKFGNIFESDLTDIWHGERLNHFRKDNHVLEVCSKCDSWKLKQLV